MVITFVSNYINHHQIPFCEAMNEFGGDVEFHFIQTSRMEKKRIDMGWEVDPKKYGYVELFYEEQDKCKRLIMESDAVIFGWSDGAVRALEDERLSSGKLGFRLSERIYREGQWKAASPRGLWHKYSEHFKFRNKPVYLLCAGAYVASDFDLIHCYPGKKLKWGYFPDRKTYKKRNAHLSESRKLKICWAGRLIKLKHPEFALKIAQELKNREEDFELNIVGDGNLREELEQLSKKYNVDDRVIFSGAKRPEEVINIMSEADIFLFTSNYLEGWGAVVNEAMQCGCALVASREAGAVPFLIKDGYNGLVYSGGSYEDFKEKVLHLCDRKDKILQFGSNAQKTIGELWNSGTAAKELVRFCGEWLEGREPQPAAEGPLSRAENIKPADFLRTMQEDNHLE